MLGEKGPLTVSKNRENRGWQHILGYFLISVLYLLIFSAHSSPLFPRYLNWDSAIFMMVGKGLNQGKRLYLDVFDHKGPVLFWIEALGMRFGRNGIFLLQCVFMTVDLYYMERIAAYFCQGRKKYFAIAAAMVWLAYPFANGNLSEEYSLPFILITMDLFLKDWNAGQKPKILHAYLYGVCFGILFFIRVNNAVTICAVILGWMYVLIRRKQPGEIWKCLIAGFAGIVTAAAPICVYFGIQGALWEMFYATFLFNLKYSGNVSLLKELSDPVILLRMGILFSPLIAAAIVFFRELKGQELKAVMEMIVALNFFALFLGHGYNHYFTVLLPIVLVMAALLPVGRTDSKNKRNLWRIAEKTLAGIVFAGYCVLAFRIIVNNFHDYYVDHAVLEEYDTVRESFSRIPEDERDSVLGYEIPAKYYLIGDVLPCYKYGILQYHWKQNDEQVMDDFLRFVGEESPSWMISEKNTSNTELQGILDEKYDRMWEDDYAVYYRLSE